MATPAQSTIETCLSVHSQYICHPSEAYSTIALLSIISKTTLDPNRIETSKTNCCNHNLITQSLSYVVQSHSFLSGERLPRILDEIVGPDSAYVSQVNQLELLSLSTSVGSQERKQRHPTSNLSTPRLSVALRPSSVLLLTLTSACLSEMVGGWFRTLFVIDSLV